MTTISNNRRRKIKPGAFLSLLFILFIAVGAFFFRVPLGSLLWRVASPVLQLKQGNAGAASVFFGQFSSNAALVAENNLLKQQLASTSILLMDRNLLVAENAELRVRLGRDQAPYPTLAAVLLAPPGIPYDTLVIDIGKDKGVREGDLVSAGGSVYIGRIANVYDTTSRVILFSSPGQTYQGLLRGSIPISLSGQGGGSIVGQLPSGIQVAVGDTVLLSSISPTYIARVASVVEHEGESFQSVYLTLPTNPYELRFVEVHAAHNP